MLIINRYFGAVLFTELLQRILNVIKFKTTVLRQNDVAIILPRCVECRRGLAMRIPSV